MISYIGLRNGRNKIMKERSRELPWQCPDHPDSKIKYTYDRTRYVFNGYPRGVGITSNYKYQCKECDRELAAPSAADRPKYGIPR